MAINIKDFLYLCQNMFAPKKYDIDTKNPKKFHISYDMREDAVYKISVEIHNEMYEFTGKNEDELFKNIIDWLSYPKEERESTKGDTYVYQS